MNDVTRDDWVGERTQNIWKKKMGILKDDADDLIRRQMAIDAMCDACSDWCDEGVCKKVSAIQRLPSAQPEYKPVTAEDFAKTMSENTVYQYMVWYGVFLTLMKERGFVICKKTM